MEKALEIRNSTAEFLIFQAVSHEEGIQILYKDETLWLTQDAIAVLFDKGRSTITEHLNNIFKTGELEENSVCRKFRRTAKDGKQYDTKYYNLDAVISVGYRVNSIRATQFRQWCTNVLKQFAIRGYVIDKKRMENGAYLSIDYFEHVLAEIREIRLSERRLYQKITDLYTTSIDYNKNAPTTKSFFAKVQNKIHYAVHNHTAAELIYNRANAAHQNMGLTSWENSPNGRIVKTDVAIAKNYLTPDELDSMGRIVNSFLDLAEEKAKKHIPMTMEDWANQLERFLDLIDAPKLVGVGKISAEIAKSHAESEFEKYRLIQDKNFESDFDLLMDEGLSEIVPDDK